MLKGYENENYRINKVEQLYIYIICVCVYMYIYKAKGTK